MSVCETVNIKDIKTKKGIQGNFLNSLLYADDKTIIEETREILKAAKAKHRKYIFNLSHGVMPDVNPLKLKLIVDEVHKFKWDNMKRIAIIGGGISGLGCFALFKTAAGEMLLKSRFMNVKPSTGDHPQF